jgi:hypothetical protein
MCEAAEQELSRKSAVKHDRTFAVEHGAMVVDSFDRFKSDASYLGRPAIRRRIPMI